MLRVHLVKPTECTIYSCILNNNLSMENKIK